MFKPKYFSFEINLLTCEMLKRAESLKAWLIDNGYKTEIRGCFDCVYFDIFIESHDRFLKADKAINDIIFFDMI